MTQGSPPVQGQDTKPIRRVLAPVDLSTPEDPDMGYAVGLAAQLGAELILLAVIDTPATIGLIRRHQGMPQSGASFNAALVEDARSILQTIVDGADELGVKAIGHVTVDEEVEEQILKEALMHRVDLIVLRSRGGSRFLRALLGSTVGEILGAAPCAVLVAQP